MKRLSPGPKRSVWSCRGHSPPLSQTGQSRGWLISRNSSTPSWAFLTPGACVSTTIPSLTSAMHEAVSADPRPVSMLTRHMRHMPTERMRGCQQNRGMYTPARSAAAMTSSPRSASTSRPSTVILSSPTSAAPGSDGRGLRAVDVGQVLVAEAPQRARHRRHGRGAEHADGGLLGGERDRRVAGVGAGARVDAGRDVGPDVLQEGEVLDPAVPGHDALVDVLHPCTPLAAGRALAAGLVGE